MRQFGLYQHVPLERTPSCRQHPPAIEERASDKDWRATQWPWTDMWRDQADTMVVDETRPDDLATYRTYLEWYSPRTRIRLTGEPPHRPLEVVHEAAIQAGPDRHRAARHDQTLDRLHRIQDKAAQAIHRGRSNMVDRMLTSMRSIYDDARAAIRTMSCGRHRDDVVARRGGGRVQGPPPPTRCCQHHHQHGHRCRVHCSPGVGSATLARPPRASDWRNCDRIARCYSHRHHGGRRRSKRTLQADGAHSREQP